MGAGRSREKRRGERENKMHAYTYLGVRPRRMEGGWIRTKTDAVNHRQLGVDGLALLSHPVTSCGAIKR